MSIESAKAFLEKVRTDDAFRKQVGEKATTEDRLEFIKTQGFDFTKEDLTEVQSELGDDELAQVAGGAWCGDTHESDDPCPKWGTCPGHTCSSRY